MSITLHRTAALIAATVVSVATASLAQTPAAPFDAFRGTSAAQYRIDLARNFFATPEAEAIARRTLLDASGGMAARTDSVREAMRRDPQVLDRTLRSMDSLRTEGSRHLAYLSLRSLLDTRDVTSNAAAQDIGATMFRDFGFIVSAIGTLPSDTVRAWTRRYPPLAKWQFFIEQVKGLQPRVDVATMSAANAVATNLTAWQPSLFQTLLRETDFGSVPLPVGSLDVRSQNTIIANSSDRGVREQGFRLNRQGLLRHRDSYAVILTTTITSRNALSRLRGFKDFRDESYDTRFLKPSDVRTLLDRLAAVAETNKRYERSRIDRVRRISGYDSIHTWDLSLPEPGGTVPRFTIAEASRIIEAAVAPLGTDYVREMHALLDPRNGRLDLYPRPNRAQRQGFSTGSVGYPSTFFQGRFDGFVEDVVVLAHEAGHSVQNMLMDAARVPSAYATGPDYFTESFAGFNELVVTDYLYRTATDRADRIYYLQRFLDQATEIFKSARESLVEDSLYALDGSMRAADDIEALEQAIGGRYSLWFGPQRERPMEWVNAVHYFTRPLYRVNYAYSKLLALTYFDRFARDSSRFSKSYSALLANGYDAEPNELLQRFVGVRLDDPALVTNAVRVIEERTAKLATLYASASPGGN